MDSRPGGSTGGLLRFVDLSGGPQAFRIANLWAGESWRFPSPGHASIKESIAISCDDTDPRRTMRLSVRPRKDSSTGPSNCAPKPSRWWQLRTSFVNEPKTSFAQFKVHTVPFAVGLGRGIFRRIGIPSASVFPVHEHHNSAQNPPPRGVSIVADHGCSSV